MNRKKRKHLLKLLRGVRVTFSPLIDFDQPAIWCGHTPITETISIKRTEDGFECSYCAEGGIDVGELLANCGINGSR